MSLFMVIQITKDGKTALQSKANKRTLIFLKSELKVYPVTY